ncbi:CHAT domain-containing tetratricopeptide repeat protein [Nostoc sp. ChiQUE01b]|uniref:CHAT domain-containing protein n=1 Tax=Nostoc sp. ChiQUE01b TaxID=3075376 RepID=UPI002AD32865|nr:CHAT domain-containing tetratricopeptide repeat protein [Nostoc sp. ChiQUE01b]MDZ8263131.1 CHAT domain-containing tetratricopeptide repeat protein [Nostoc sp. ChiQUE01b]
MKKILTSLLAVGFYLTPLTVMLMAQPTWGQTQNLQAQEAQRLLEQGIKLTQQQEHQKAIQILQPVPAMAQELKDQKLERTVLVWLGFNYNALGEKQKALDFYNQALPLFRAVGDRAGVATTLNNIGLVYDALGEKQKALDFFNQALPLYRAVGERTDVAATLNNIGKVYNALGEKQKALDFYNQALPLIRAVGDRSGVATTLNNIGAVYNALGEKQKALEFYNQALPLIRAVGDRTGVAIILGNIGLLFQSTNRPTQAITNNSLKSPGVQNAVPPKLQAVLAFGNPVPSDPQNLPGAEAEVRSIKEILPDSEVYIHNEATLEKFRSQALRFSFLHLATHGCFKTEDCKKVKLKNNTLLFADKPLDIANAALLGLQGTQLITLSACQTAVDTNLNDASTGLAGVAYIFERAGAKAVMASLWAVDDEATQQLMIQFYQNLKQGMTKGEALQQAKLKLIKDHPYYWSPFVLIGDAR